MKALDVLGFHRCDKQIFMIIGNVLFFGVLSFLKSFAYTFAEDHSFYLSFYFFFDLSFYTLLTNNNTVADTEIENLYYFLFSF